MVLLRVWQGVVWVDVIECGAGGERRKLVRTFLRWIQDAHAWRCGLDFALFSGFRGLEFRMLRLIVVMVEFEGGDADMIVTLFYVFSYMFVFVCKNEIVSIPHFVSSVSPLSALESYLLPFKGRDDLKINNKKNIPQQ